MAFIKKGIWIGTLLLLPAAFVCGAEQTPDFSQGVSPGYFLKLIAALAFVLAVFFVLTWLLKRFHRMPAASHGIRVIGGTTIGSKERLMLVQVGEQQLLLGVTPTSVNTLLELDTPLPESENIGTGAFESILKNTLNTGEKL